MKITERRLRAIIKSVIKESSGSHSQVMRALKDAVSLPNAQSAMDIVYFIAEQLGCPADDTKESALYNVLAGFDCFNDPQGEYFTGPGYADRTATMDSSSTMFVLPEGERLSSLCIAIDAICKS